MTHPPPSFSDAELQQVIDAAAALPVEQRGRFLERVAANLEKAAGLKICGPIADLSA